MQQIPSLDQLAENLRSHEKSNAPGIEAPAGVIYNVVEQPASHRVIVHLLNDRSAPAGHITINLKRKYRSATLLSPDLSHDLRVTIHQQPSEDVHIIVPGLETYSMLVLNP
jgi:hypothetical protein